MQFYFIRHGQSENNLLWNNTKSTTGRSVDAELSPMGKEQAACLAEFLARSGSISQYQGEDLQNIQGFHFTHLYTSLMMRAVGTADIVSKRLGMPLTGWIEIHETGGIYREDKEKGEYYGVPGKNREFFETYYPDIILPARLGPDGWWNRSLEKPEEKLPRAKKFITDLLEKHGRTEDRVTIFSHGGFYQYFMKALLGLSEKSCFSLGMNTDFDSPISFSINNVGITRVDFTKDGFTVVYLNRVDFLPREIVT
jgi:2,3-bisphosphoglycerate-dependent phosphoglycerate mutase